MQSLDDLARAIDAASDAHDIAALRVLGQECERRLDTIAGDERVYLLYYQSNTYSAIIASQPHDANSQRDWDQPEAVQSILSLRRAISEPSFKTVHPIVACQIRTNLANRLNALGRPVAANEQWLKVLEIVPHFAKALANRARSIAFYGRVLYDKGHTSCLLAAARSLFDDALHEDAIWESGDRDVFVPRLVDERNQITAYLIDVAYNEDYDLNQWSLGATEEERSYRRWCLYERLFLNPLNEAYTDSVAATDVLHLPSHTYRIGEPPRFPLYYNLLKQEYISARYRLYRAVSGDGPDFLMREVLMLGNGEDQVFGHVTEDIRAAFRSAYSIFDKIGLFVNDYFQIGIRPEKVTFRKVWFENWDKSTVHIRPVFSTSLNRSLQGLYFLSKDLFDDAFKEASEPDAAELARLRQQLEHRFLSFQDLIHGESTDTHRFISVGDFRANTLRILKMAREALIYLSLAMHREEALRKERENPT